jgi:hypothetical protein
VTAATLLEDEALGALLSLHLEMLAAALTLEALDLEALVAATAAAATAHLEGLASTATALNIRLAAVTTATAATAARSGFRIVVAMSAAAGLGHDGGRDRQRSNAGRQE